MSLDLGTLVGHLELDDSKWDSKLDSATTALKSFETRTVPKAKAAGEAVGEGIGDGAADGLKGTEGKLRDAGEDVGESLGEGIKAKGAMAAGAAAVVVSAAFVEALDVGAAEDKLVAALGARGGRAQKYTRLASDLYKGAWGESIDDVNTAIASTVTSVSGMRRASIADLERVTIKALDFASTFDVDVPRAVQVAGTVVNTGLVKNANRAFDLLTRGSQKVPAALREDLQDAVEEYGQFFAGLGYSGQQTFAMLVDASDKGIYGIDKMGDAVKEFTIRGTDMSEASKDAYEAIGLDAEEMANKIVRGGDQAQDATRKVIDGLLGIESPSQRANTAIALFGTPLEDLNVKDVPAFLRGLKGMSDSMDGFRGASRRMGNELNDNAKTKVTEFTRGVKTEFIEWFADEAIPFIEDDLVPAFKDIGDALDNLPSWAVKGAAGGLLGALLLGKVGNVAGGIRNLLPTGGGLPGVASKANPIPVWVVNGGLPGPGGPDVDAPGGSRGSRWGRFMKGAGFAARRLGPAGAALYGSEMLLDYAEENYPKRTPRDDDEHAKRIARSFYAAEDAAAALNGEAETLRDHLTVITNGATVPFKAPGLADVLTRTKEYEGILEGIPERVVTDFVSNVHGNNTLEETGSNGGRTPLRPGRGRQAPLVNIERLTHTDMRETRREANRWASLEADGGVALP